MSARKSAATMPANATQVLTCDGSIVKTAFKCDAVARIKFSFANGKVFDLCPVCARVLAFSLVDSVVPCMDDSKALEVRIRRLRQEEVWR
jgi:hypothetical protein